MSNLESILKSRDITLPRKVHLVKAMVFPVVMYGCESWTIKQAEHWRTDAFWTVVLEKTLESPLDNKEIQSVHPKGNQSWIFTGKTDVKAETPILRPCDAKNWLLIKLWCWARLKTGGEGDDSRWDGWMASPTQWTWVCVNSWGWWWTGKPGLLQSMGSQKVRYYLATELKRTECCLLYIYLKVSSPFFFFFLEEFEEDEVLIFPWMFDRIHHPSLLVLDFSLLGNFDLWFSLLAGNWSGNSTLHDSVLERCVFLWTYSFLLHCPICWHIFVHSSVYDTLSFCDLTCNISFISDFINLSSLSWWV